MFPARFERQRAVGTPAHKAPSLLVMVTRSFRSALVLFAGGVIVVAFASRSLAADDFVKDVQPVLETNCVSCHHGEKAEGGLDLSNRASAFKSGSEPAIVASKPDESPLYKRLIVSKDDESLMPPIKEGGPLDKKSIVTLRMW